jgi:hypothetical protein
MSKVKLTKTALNKFIQWSTSRYNDYLGYGTKKWNVERIYKALQDGNYNGETTFVAQCASPLGENGSGRNWRINGGGDEYTVDCVSKKITTKYTGRVIEFL